MTGAVGDKSCRNYITLKKPHQVGCVVRHVIGATSVVVRLLKKLCEMILATVYMENLPYLSITPVLVAYGGREGTWLI